MLFTSHARLLYCVALVFISGCATSPPPREAIHADQNLVPLTTQTADDASVVHRPEDRLISAAATGDRDAVQGFLDQGVSVDCLNKDQWTPLLAALRHGHHMLAEMLIDAGADIHRQQTDQWTAMHMICRYGVDKTELAKMLLDRGADPNFRNRDGYSPLHFAAKGGNHVLIQLLLEHDVDVEAKTNGRETALAIAVQNKHPDAAILLWRASYDRRLGRRYNKKILKAVKANDTEALEALQGKKGTAGKFKKRRMAHRKEGARQGKNRDWTLLHMCARFGNAELAKKLIRKGAKVDVRDDLGWTPLHLAVRYGHKDMGRLLHKSGADVKVKDKQKMTPLHLAATNKEAKVATLLVDQKADINAVDKDGATPLHMAAFHGSAENVKLLLNRGASVRKRIAIGHSALNLAAIASGDNSAVMEMLLNAGDKICDVEGAPDLTAAAHEAVGRHHIQKGRTSAAAESLRHAVESYDRAIAYFEQEIKSLETKETLRQAAVVMLSVFAMALESYNAKLQADQFAELSALSQASRSGAGYGGYFRMLHQTRSLVQIHQPMLTTYHSGFWGLPSISQNSPAALQSASFQQKVSMIKDKIANCRVSAAQCRRRLAKLSQPGPATVLNSTPQN